MPADLLGNIQRPLFGQARALRHAHGNSLANRRVGPFSGDSDRAARPAVHHLLGARRR
ncbi:hypothetical protein ACWDSJ_17975 [Nocardia sp. NPDC003482]